MFASILKNDVLFANDKQEKGQQKEALVCCFNIAVELKEEQTASQVMLREKK